MRFISSFFALLMAVPTLAVPIATLGRRGLNDVEIGGYIHELTTNPYMNPILTNKNEMIGQTTSGGGFGSLQQGGPHQGTSQNTYPPGNGANRSGGRAGPPADDTHDGGCGGGGCGCTIMRKRQLGGSCSIADHKIALANARSKAAAAKKEQLPKGSTAERSGKEKTKTNRKETTPSLAKKLGTPKAKMAANQPGSSKMKIQGKLAPKAKASKMKTPGRATREPAVLKGKKASPKKTRVRPVTPKNNRLATHSPLKAKKPAMIAQKPVKNAHAKTANKSRKAA